MRSSPPRLIASTPSLPVQVTESSKTSCVTSAGVIPPASQDSRVTQYKDQTIVYIKELLQPIEVIAKVLCPWLEASNKRRLCFKRLYLQKTLDLRCGQWMPLKSILGPTCIVLSLPLHFSLFYNTAYATQLSSLLFHNNARITRKHSLCIMPLSIF